MFFLLCFIIIIFLSKLEKSFVLNNLFFNTWKNILQNKFSWKCTGFKNKILLKIFFLTQFHIWKQLLRKEKETFFLLSFTYDFIYYYFFKQIVLTITIFYSGSHIINT